MVVWDMGRCSIAVFYHNNPGRGAIRVPRWVRAVIPAVGAGVSEDYQCQTMDRTGWTGPR